jgi:hypothetical protein
MVYLVCSVVTAPIAETQSVMAPNGMAPNGMAPNGMAPNGKVQI